MVTSVPLDDQTDEQEQPDIDIDSDADVDLPADPEAGGEVSGGGTTAAPDLPPGIEEEIKKVIVDEEELAPTKSKNQLLPPDLINKELEPDDLFDKGSI